MVKVSSWKICGIVGMMIFCAILIINGSKSDLVRKPYFFLQDGHFLKSRNRNENGTELSETFTASSTFILFSSTYQDWLTTKPAGGRRVLTITTPAVLDSINGSTRDSLSDASKLVKGEVIADMFPCPDSIGKQLQCQRYQPDWYNKVNMGELLEERMIKVRKKCKQFYSTMFNASLSEYGKKSSDVKILNAKRMLFSEKTKLGFCWMPKMGSTFWKRAWVPLNSAASRRSKRSQTKLITQVFKRRKSSGDLQKYTIYSIARSPWDRLVSVYREKCEKNKGSRCQLRLGYKCKYCPTFTTFVRCVVNSMSKERTEYYGHVDTTYHRCGVCDYPYNYIVLMENMINETEFIMKEAGVKHPTEVMEQVRNKTIRSVEKQAKTISYADYWKKVPSRLIDKVRFYLRYEIFLFDYPETPFYIKPS